MDIGLATNLTSLYRILRQDTGKVTTGVSNITAVEKTDATSASALRSLHLYERYLSDLKYFFSESMTAQ